MKTRPNVVDWTCGVLAIAAAATAAVELAVILRGSSVHRATHVGAIVGFGWFGCIALVFASVPLTRALRAVRGQLSRRRRVPAARHT